MRKMRRIFVISAVNQCGWLEGPHPKGLPQPGRSYVKEPDACRQGGRSQSFPQQICLPSCRRLEPAKR